MKKMDFCLLILILIVAIFVGVTLFSSSDEGKYLIISSGGEEYKRLELDKDMEISVNGKNTVVIKDRKVYVSYADCPDKLCIKQGVISDASKTICCLANKMVVKIEE